MTIDPASLEILKNALGSIADEMALVVLRTAYSPIVRDSMDYSTAVFDGQGRAIAQGLTLAIHLGAFPDAMRQLMREQASSTRPGDMFILNDPYASGGMHLPDVYVIQPVFFEETLAGFAATIVHHADIGGLAPGSMALAATEIHQEGVRIPLVKLYREGVANDDLIALLALNSRMPVQLRGDLRAQVSACRAGERGLLALLAKHGLKAFNGYVDALHAYAHTLARNAVAAMPDGDYEHMDFIDGLGDAPTPITFRVKVSVRAGHVTVDWAGTSAQIAGAINCPIATTNSVALAALRSAIGVEVPNCEGFNQVLTVKAEPGSIVHPHAPAACAARGVLAYRMFDVLLGAFAKIVPHRMPALGEGGPSVVSLSGRAQGQPWLITDGVLGSWGGRPASDGVDGIASPLGNMSNQPVELIEARVPVQVTRYGLVPDSGGAGRQRGGMAVVREYRLLGEGAALSLRSDRRDHLPAGVEGGLCGSPSLNILVNEKESRLLPVMPSGLIPMREGDRLVHIAASAGGHGDPLERDPDAVLQDVLDGRVSTRYARDVYGVVLDAAGRKVDSPASAALRRDLAPEPMAERVRRQLRCFSASNELPAAWVGLE
ncbi:MAG TPA: hydantoinase B/oxoprolinase family protein [Burkholderiaceae bacterium]|nr:hydantoinase B/oxoprolinase family protein [Burkholderiaceae bacterium]